jgi:tRNA pseudouridine32 synthase/23S rRNA pseudouridine746 synthase
MVVARNSTAASKLCHAWRERDIVQKTYLAYCQRWPPYHDEQLSEGTIDLPLAASRTERIKWEVRALEDGGKPCLTSWKIYGEANENTESFDQVKSELTVERDNDNGVVLELKPITGRTHQLRVHCATIGSGIVGDSLYGDSPVEWFGDKPQHGQQTISQSDTQTLRLHAHKLVFPHPSTGSEVTFVSPKLW